MFNAREEVLNMENEVENIERESQSFAMEFVQTLKLQNKRLFICWLVTFIAFIGLLGYTIWLYNDITVETSEYTQEITDIETIENSTMLSDLQKELLEDKIKGLTIVEMSMKRGASPEKVKREIKEIKNRIFKVI